MKKILVPIDFTEYSNNALKVAIYIARIKRMSIKLVNIVDAPTMPVFLYGIPESYVFPEPNQKYFQEHITNTKEHLNRIAAYVRTEEIEVDYEVLQSDSGISKEIAKQSADLIVMGARHENAGPGLLLGSVTEKVIRLASSPVITVSELNEDFKIKHILFASDFEEPETATIIERIIKFADIFGAQLHFLTVDTDNLAGASTKHLEKLADKFDLQGYNIHMIHEGDKEKGILDYAEEIGADIISLCTHGKKGLRYFFFGSLAEDVALDSEVPVLIYNIDPKKIEKTGKHTLRESIRGHHVGGRKQYERDKDKDRLI